MGNQQGKAGKRSAGQVHPSYPFNEPEKKSRTDWTAGVPLSPGRPIVQLSCRPAGQTVDENSVTDEINITWAVPKDDGGFPITGYKIEMLDIQTNNWIEITFIEGFEPRCTLSNILYGIMYRFRVIAYNDAGPSEPGDASEPVVIDVPGVQIAPYFVLMINDTIALEHEKVEFKVKVLGTPKPSVQWFKDDMEVFSSDRLEIREEEDGGAVVLRAARLNDSGNIKCVATNILGRATTVAQLIIEASPRLDIPETYNDGLIFRYDEVIRLKIPMIAKPPPRITWFFDDEPISASEDVQIETTETLTSLRIGAAKRWHCGEFRVLAQNENGEDSASILVTVTAPPSSPGQPVVIDITGTSCVLRWEPVQDDGGADVKHYIVEYFRDVWDVWLKAKTTKECQVTIEDLIPGSRYKFRIKAENAYGISEESEESDPFDVNQPLQSGAGVQSVEPRNPTISISTENEWSETESGPVRKQPPPALAETKVEWESQEASEDVFKDLLRVKKLSQRVSSVESDGLPSMTSVTGDNESVLSESSDLQRARKMYAELQAMSLESATHSDEDLPDLDAYAKEFYNEIRALSIDTGGSMADILDNIGLSSESLSSIIPHEKREELASFEMSLKQMIDEAKMLAESSRPGSLAQSQEDLVTYRRSTSQGQTPMEEGRRSRKSGSGASATTLVETGQDEEKEMQRRWEEEQRQREEEERRIEEEEEMKRMKEAEMMRIEEERLRRMEEEEEMRKRQEEEMMRMQEEEMRRQEEEMIKMQEDEMRRRRMSPEEEEPVPMSRRGGVTVSGRGVTPPEDVPPPPLEELEPPVAPVRTSPAKPAATQGRRGPVKANREPSVGADRYEDIITEVRKRSVSRGPNSRMGSRTSSTLDFQSVTKVDLDSVRSSLGTTHRTADLETKTPAKPSVLEGPKPPAPYVPTRAPIVPPVTVEPPTPQPQPQVSAKPPLALDANCNSTAPSLPTVPPRAARPSEPDPLVKMFPKNIPHWFVITYTYSVVLILILLVANSTPDGKLYIHFTAFWSLVLYFLLEDDQTTDLLDSVVEGYFLKK